MTLESKLNCIYAEISEVSREIKKVKPSQTMSQISIKPHSTSSKHDVTSLNANLQISTNKLLFFLRHSNTRGKLLNKDLQSIFIDFSNFKQHGNCSKL
jgi:hypothetical protein